MPPVYGSHGSMETFDSTGGSYRPIPTSEVNSVVDVMNELRSIESAAEDARIKCSAEPGRRHAVYHSLHFMSNSFSFVNLGRFQALVAVVILANTFMMAAEAGSKAMKETLFIPEQILLGFYIFELVCRIFHFQSSFLCGAVPFVCWNLLDVTWISAGAFEQWFLPLLPIAGNSSVHSVLGYLRILRLVRVFKIIRIFMEADLLWCEEPPFQSFIGLVITFNSVLMGLETDIKWDGWFYIEQCLLLIYVFELAVRLRRDGCTFFYQEIIWNWLDLIIVGSSVLDGWIMPIFFMLSKGHETGNEHQLQQVMMLMRMLRLMRILRLARLVKSIRPLYNMVMGVLAAVQAVFWVLVLTLATLYAVGIIATRLIGQGLLLGGSGSNGIEEIEGPFKTVPDSMFMLFKLMSGAQTDADADQLDLMMGRMPAIKFVFVWFTVTSSWTLLSILTAVVSDNMIATTERQEKMLQMTNADADRKEHAEELRALFQDMDTDGSGTITPEELSHFLEDPLLREACAQSCRVPARDVQEVMNLLYEANGRKDVEMEEFIKCLFDVGSTATEKSVMKLEARLSALEKNSRSMEASQSRFLEDLATKLEPKQESGGMQMQTALDAISRTLDSRLGSFETASKEATAATNGFLQKQELWQLQRTKDASALESLLTAQFTSIERRTQLVTDALQDRVHAMERSWPDKDSRWPPLLGDDEHIAYSVPASDFSPPGSLCAGSPYGRSAYSSKERIETADIGEGFASLGGPSRNYGTSPDGAFDSRDSNVNNCGASDGHGNESAPATQSLISFMAQPGFAHHGDRTPEQERQNSR